MAKQAETRSHLVHVDFIPETKYERFDSLITRANQWLTRCPDCQLITAQTSDTKYKTYEEDPVDPDKTTYTVKGESRMRFVRSLRLWVTSASNCKEVQQIGHYNIIPVEGYDTYEDFSQTLDRLNKRLKTNPIPGRILNLETLEVKFHTGSQDVDANESYWENYKATGTRFLHILRVFYIMGYPLLEEIGFADFKPQVTDEGEGYASVFEPFGHVINKASMWIKKHPDLNVVSVQSINYKVKGSAALGSVNTHRTMYFEGPTYTKYLRIVRVGYVIRNDQSESGMRACPVTLTYKDFVPYSLSLSSFMYEGFAETVQRLNHWLHHTGADIISIETVPIILDGGRQHGDPEVVFTRVHGEDSMLRYLKVIRCYFNGYFTEPPPAALPPPPEETVDDEDCCAIS